MMDHAISNGNSTQIRKVVESLMWAAKDFIPNGSSGAFDEADRQEAMAAFRDLAFEADTGKDATADVHDKTNHWLSDAEVG